MKQSLGEIVALAAQADGPTLTRADGMPKIGGVDPLGLRQLNFDLMDAVLPGLNNVSRRIRPYVVVAWAARQARRLAEDSGAAMASGPQLKDFVDRIEVIYAWSQFLRKSDAPLPGSQVLRQFVNAERYVFGGADWEGFRENRKASTAFTAAITYGPSIKALKWAGPVPGGQTAWAPGDLFDEALDAFEATLGDELNHPAFSSLGLVEVERTDVERWGALWDLNIVTDTERAAFSDSLVGPLADGRRRDTLTLVRDVLDGMDEPDIDELRAAMVVVSGNADPTRVAWRRLQVRQAFRFALESWFYWCLAELDPNPKSTAALVDAFRQGALGWAASERLGAWLEPSEDTCPIELMAEISSAIADDWDAVPEAICRTLAFCLTEEDSDGGRGGRTDRLPLQRARAEAVAWANTAPAEFLTHMMETWLFAQHAYWSSSRGLADARANGKVILRLRVTLDEGGWRLTRLGGIGGPPYPTQDRLETAWLLAKECGFIPPGQ